MEMQPGNFPSANSASGDADAVLGNDEFVQAYAAAARLLGTCFAYSPKTPAASNAWSALFAMDVADDWPFGGGRSCGGQGADALAFAARLLRSASDESQAARAEEYQRLFVWPGHLQAPPWGSVYMDRDKVLYGCTWVELREWMREHGVASEYDERVPEDQIGRVLVMSAEVALAQRDALPELIGRHIAPWAGHYFDVLGDAAHLASYKGIALLAKATLSDVVQLLEIEPAKRRLYL